MQPIANVFKLKPLLPSRSTFASKIRDRSSYSKPLISKSLPSLFLHTRLRVRVLRHPSLLVPTRTHSVMASTDETPRGGKAVLASQRAKEEAEAKGEKPKSRFANIFPLSYKETFNQWV